MVLSEAFKLEDNLLEQLLEIDNKRMQILSGFNCIVDSNRVVLFRMIVNTFVCVSV